MIFVRYLLDSSPPITQDARRSMRRTPKQEQPSYGPSLFFGFSALDITLAASGAGLLLVFLYLMQNMLTPPILAGAGIILLWPVRKHHTIQAIMLTGAFLLLVWLLHKLSTILIPFASIYLLAYLFDPLVSFLFEKYRVRRWFSSLVVTLLFVSVIALFVLLLAPNLIGQLDALAARTLTSIQDLQQWLLTSPAVDELALAGLSKEALVAQFTETIQNFLHSWATVIPNSVEQMLVSVGSVFGAITISVLMPISLFYTLKDYGIIKTGIKKLLPTIGGKHDYLSHTGQIVGQYLRGQLTISAITALTVSVALMLGGIPFALLIGVIAGLLNMIPNLGGIITNLIGIFIALMFGDRGLVDVVIVVAVLLGQSLLEQAVLIPRILSQHVGLHPIVILLSLFIFGYFFGFLGLFVAVPLTALLITAYENVRQSSSLDLLNFLELEERDNPEPPRSDTPVKNIDTEPGVTFSLQNELIEHESIEAVPVDAGGE